MSNITSICEVVDKFDFLFCKFYYDYKLNCISTHYAVYEYFHVLDKTLLEEVCYLILSNTKQ